MSVFLYMRLDDMKKLLLQAIALLSMASLQASTLSVQSLSEKLTKNQIKQGIDGVINILDKNYIFPKKVRLIEKELKHKLVTSEFDQINDWYSFIRHISPVIKNVSGDMYLDIVETKPSFILEKAQRKLGNKESYPIHNVKVLAGNVGYLKLNYFHQNSKAEMKIANVMDELSTADALIIDLRTAEGESIALAQYLMSFFVEEGVVLSEVVYDKDHKKIQLKALKNNGANKFKNNFPIYILTSSFLSSSGEFISYTLKHLNKAVIVGEETMGVAYVLQKKKINDYISINIPIAIPFHPITNTNWSGIGVIPDLHSKASLSLDAAHKMALQHLGMFSFSLDSIQ